MAGGNAFLQGQYLEVGINQCGGFGTTINAPAGYHARSGLGNISEQENLGFVADVQKNGWTVGTPNKYNGDYFLPQSPRTGWGISFGSNHYSNDRSGTTNTTCGTFSFAVSSIFPGTIQSVTNGANYTESLWQGTTNGMQIQKRVRVKTDELYFTVTVKLKNTSAAPISNVYYGDYMNPDNDFYYMDVSSPPGGGVLTLNTVVHQNPGSNKALVKAVGNVSGSYIGLGTYDCRAKVARGTGGSTEPDGTVAQWYTNPAASNFTQAIGPDNQNWNSIMSVAFNIGTIPAGDSTTFTYVFILDETDLDEALAETAPGFTVNGTPYLSGDTVSTCGVSSFNISITNGQNYTWNWSPSTALNTTTGLNVTAIPATTITYIATGTGSCGTKYDTITIRPNTRLYVDSSAVISGNGSSWATALRTITEALNIANANHCPQEIWVRKGTYKPTTNSGAATTSRDSAFRILRNGIKVYGGFAGTESLLSERNAATNVTILSGDIGAVNDSTDNSYTVLLARTQSMSGPADTLHSVADGFTILRGNGNNLYPGNTNINNNFNYAGGIVARASGGFVTNLDVTNCIIRNNFGVYGGGVFSWGNGVNSPCNLTLQKCVLQNNNAAFGGGACAAAFPAGSADKLNVYGCIFLNNSTISAVGSAIVNDGDGAGALVTTNVVSTTFYGHIGTPFYNVQQNSGASSMGVSNSIVWKSGTAYTSLMTGTPVTFNTSDLFLPSVTGTNINTNPYFYAESNPVGADNLWGTADDGLRLAFCSPAINAGLNAYLPASLSTDFNGGARTQQGVTDMGAYESASSGARIYVNGSVALTGSGTSWASPFKTVSEALNYANSYACANEIWVAAGTYYPMAGNAVATSRDSSFRILRNGIRVYGGFAGGETLLSARNITANSTILSGDIGTAGDSTDNSYHVMTVVATATQLIDTTTVVDGFTVTRGNANGAGSFLVNGQTMNQIDGAGIYLFGLGAGNACSPKLANNVFARNSAQYGAGIYAGGYNAGKSSPVIRKSSFTNNTALYYGGGIGFFGEAKTSLPIVDSCTFFANATTVVQSYGGGAGIYSKAAFLTLTNSTLENNTAVSGAGFKSGFSKAIVTNTNFLNNTIDQTGGNIFSNSSDLFTPGGGAAFHCFGDSIFYTGCLISGNTGLANGGIWASGFTSADTVHLAISKCIFRNNAATGFSGGAVKTEVERVRLLIDNSIFEGNTAGGASAGAVLAVLSRLVITQSVFSNNAAASGIAGAVRSENGIATITGSTFSNNTSANAPFSLAVTGGGTFLLNNSVVGGVPAGHIPATGMTLQNSLVKGAAVVAPNLSSDPYFVNAADPDGADNTWATGDDGLRLTPCSPGINAGSNGLVPAGITTDISGGTRIQNTTVDMGAYEHPYNFVGYPDVTISTPTTILCAGDPATFTAVSVNGGTAGYQWFKNSTLVQSSTSATYTSATLVNSDTVWVVLANTACGYTDTSNRIVLTVTPPVIYVDSSIAVSGAGDSWTTAKKTVAEALLFANNVTCATQIWVKKGTYFPMNGAAIAASRDSSLRILRNGIKVYGGFAGNEILLSARNITANPTILSGDIGTAGDTTDNAYHVMTIVGNAANNIDTNTVVDGFTVERGNAENAGTLTISGMAVYRGAGGGINTAGLGAGCKSSPLLANITFRNNKAEWGGGLYGQGHNSGTSSPVVRNCAFTGNRSLVAGGGLHFYSSGAGGSVSPVISNSTFTSNYSDYQAGGGFVDAASPAVSSSMFNQCTFSNNSNAATTGGYNGGALFLIGNAATPTVKNSTFTGNYSRHGAGIYSNNLQLLTIDSCTFSQNTSNQTGAGVIADNGTVTVSNSTFTDNQAVSGGALSIYTTAAFTVTNCVFDADSASLSGGAVYHNTNGTSTFTGCRFTNNHGVLVGAVDNPAGGTIRFTRSVFSNNAAGNGTTGAALGGVLNNNLGTANFTNCVLTGNKTTSTGDNGGGAVHVETGTTVSFFNSTLSNNTTASAAQPNGNALSVDAGGTLNLNNTIVWGAAAQQVANSGTITYNYSDVKGIVPPANSISLDPQFINASDPDGADNIWATSDDGLRLTPCSPAINAGSNALIPAGVTTDITAATRIQNTTVDMGAYEMPNNSTGLPDIAITKTSATVNCSSAPVTFSATTLVAPGGTTNITWFVNSTSVQTGSGTTYGSSTLANNDTVWAVLFNADCNLRDTSNRIVITVTSVPAQPSAITGATTVCPGLSQTYSVTNDPAVTTYNWTLPTGWTGTSTTNTITVTPGSTGGTITVTGSNFCGPGAPSSLAVTAIAVPAQPGPIAGASAVCAGVSQTYSVTAVTYATSYTWTLPVGWTGSSNTNTITVIPNGTGGTISVTAAGACGTSAASTKPVTSTVIPATPSAITGATAVCAGVAQTYSVTADPNVTSYTWTLPTGWTGSSTTSTITVTPNGTGGTITVTGANYCGPSAASTKAVTSTIIPVQPSTISGPAAVCTGISATYSVTADANVTSYTWTIPAGWSGSSTTNTITVIPTATGGTITVNGTNYCGPGVVRTLSVTSTATPAQPGTITGAAAVCAGIPQTYSVTAVANATTYTWTLPAGWSGTSTTNTITVTPTGTGGTVSVTASNYCGTSAAATKAVSSTVIPVQPTAISGSTAVCAGVAQTYTVTADPNVTTYAWTLPAGWTGSSTTNTITAIPTATGGTISVTGSNYCGPSAVRTLAVSSTATPAQPGTISGAAAICNGSTQTYTVAAVANATSYSWSFPAGWSGASTTNTITVVASATSGAVSVTASNYCGTSTAQSLAVTVTSIPVQPGAISGSITPCEGTQQTYSIGAVPAATSYAWSYPSGWIGGSVTTSISLLTSVSSGAVSVTASNFCGTSPAQSLGISTIPLPAQPQSISGPVQVCSGTQQTYSVPLVPNTSAYQWTLPAGWIGTSTTNTITVTTGTTSGTITVSAFGVCGYGPQRSLSVTTTQTVIPTVSAQVTSPGGNVICAGTPVTFSQTSTNAGTAPVYTWRRNGAVVWIGATYTAYNLQNGDSVTVSVTSSTTCAIPQTVTGAAIYMTVNPVVVPGINISTTPPASLCAGTQIVLYTNTVGGGSSPQYQWYKNGAIISGQTDDSLMVTAATGTDTFTVQLLSNAPCATPQTAGSNKRWIVGVGTVTPTISVTASPGVFVPAGSTVVFTASYTNGGVNPVFRWRRNGVLVAGAISATYVGTNIQNSDTVSAELTNYDGCAIPGTVRAGIRIGTPTGIGSHPTSGTWDNSGSIVIHPNPSSGRFEIDAEWGADHIGERVVIELYNALGQTVYSTEVKPDKRKWTVSVWLGDAVANGIYQLSIRTPTMRAARPVLLSR